MNSKDIREDIFEDPDDERERVIADMSGVGHGLSWFGRNRMLNESDEKNSINVNTADANKKDNDRPWEEHKLSRDERKYFMKGALKASLLIWAAYAVGIGGFIAIFCLLASRAGF